MYKKMTDLELKSIHTNTMKPEVKTTSKTIPVMVNGLPIGGPDFAVIAGPCSIESKSQFQETAQAVQNLGAAFLRGGIWKMRTNAATFQGLGTEAFQFVQEVLDHTGLSLVSEVTDARQIEMLDDYVEMYQVGARNMYNYSLLRELGQTRKPVMLKRSFSALIEEWIKAADYITAGGNDKVILCERGIRTFETATRYTFDLNAVIWAKQNTHFPIIVDPSHAVGIRSMVPKVAYAAAAVGADGIIVEVHPRPAEALSDGKQALTVPDFKEMMSTIERILEATDRGLLKA
jgi:3-deoxy-7-phosphoheptulonate synthase